MIAAGTLPVLLQPYTCAAKAAGVHLQSHCHLQLRTIKYPEQELGQDCRLIKLHGFAQKLKGSYSALKDRSTVDMGALHFSARMNWTKRR